VQRHVLRVLRRVLCVHMLRHVLRVQRVLHRALRFVGRVRVCVSCVCA
jgi:hypothetical protein